MFGIHDFGVFVAAGVLLNLTPGQDTLYILGRAIAHGRAIGVASALGIGTGCLLHTGAAALGVSALIAASPAAFTLLKIAGAAYLIYLGAGMLLGRAPVADTPVSPAAANARAAFRQGVLTNITNPKVALFFLAFLPQFIDPASPDKLAAFLLLGSTFVATGTLWCLILALAAARARTWLSPAARGSRWLARAAGLLFIALGVRLAASDP